MATKTVLFIHGLFMTHRCWDGWVKWYEAKDYTCHAVPYPGRDKTPAQLRAAHPDPKAAELTFDSVLEHYTRVVQSLPEAPLIIGHSLGGLLAQVLLNRGLGAGAVTVSSGPPQGVLVPSLSFFRCNFPVLNPLNASSRPYLMPFSAFQYAFVNGLPEAEQRRIYDAQVPPESLRIPRGVLTSKNAKLDFSKAHAPLLMLGCGDDHIIPPALARANFNRYKASSSVTVYHEFAKRTHYAIGQMGWEELADYSYNWAKVQGI